MVISFENVAVVTAISVALLPRAPMFYPERGDVDLAGESCYGLYFFPTQFAHVAEPCPTKQITCPMGRDHRGRTIKLMERAHVEMIEVRVGQKHDVDLGEVANGQRGRGQAFRSECKPGQPDSDAWKKDWISENLYPEKIDQYRCVPEPCRGYPVIAPLRWIWPSESRSDWTPAFDSPFVPEIGVPTASA